MAVREAVESDVEELVAMVHELAEFERAADEVELTTEGLRHHLFGPDRVAAALVAHPDGRHEVVAGMALYFRTFSTWVGQPGIWLEDLFVRPDHRRHGHARALLEGLAARTPGRIEWDVLDWNDDAVAFYRGLGATPVEGWTRYRWAPGRGR